MNFLKMTYSNSQKRKLGFLFLLLIFNVSVIPLPGNFQIKPDVAGHEIISADVDSVILNTINQKNKKSERNIASFLEGSLLPKISNHESATKPIQKVILTRAPYINELKMEEAFLLTHFSTDI